MRHHILSIIFLLLFSNPFSVSADTPVKVGIYQNKPKIFTDSEGKAKGFYIDILEYIASKEGWRIEYVPGTWDQCLQRLENGKIDLLPDIAFSEERAKRFDFNQKTVLSNWAVVFTRKDAEIESFADLNGKKIAFMKGGITLEQFKSQIKPFGIDFSVVESDDYKGVFKLLHEKKADAGLVNQLFGVRHEKQYNVSRSPIICCPRELRFAVPKNKNPHLIEAVDRHLIALRKDKNSMYYRAWTQWIEKAPLLKLPRWILNGLLFAIGLVILFLVTTVVLRGQVKARTAELSTINKELRQEIENRKQVEKKLRVSEEKFLKAFHSSPDAITLTSMEDGRFVEINDRGLRLTGYDRDEVIGLTTVELNLWTDPADRERFMELLRKESLVLDMEANFHTKVGKIRTGLISGEIFYLQDSPHLISIIRDITDLKQTEAKIQQRSNELESINAILSAITTRLELQSILDQSLQSALDLTGLESGTLCLVDRGKGGLTLASANNASSEMVRDLSAGGLKFRDCLCGDAAQTGNPFILWDNASETKYSTLEAVCNEGIRFHAAFPLMIKGRAIGVLCVFAHSEIKPSERNLKLVQGICGPIALVIENAQLYDEAKQHVAELEKRVDARTTELNERLAEVERLNRSLAKLLEDFQHANKELEKARDKAEAADRVKSAFLAAMSHELRTPLNSIIGFTGIMLQGLSGPLNDEQVKQLSMVRNSGRHLLNLINDVLDISKIEAGQLEIITQPFSLHQAVESAVQVVAPLVEKKAQALFVEIAPVVDRMVSDQRRVKQILINLLNNAVKFTPEGGEIRLTAERVPGSEHLPTHTDQYPTGNFIEISVSDTGIGIKPEDQNILFQPFHQVDTGLTRRYEGTGLGLSICKRLVEKLGGKIWAKSEGERKGSTFTFTLPLG